MAECFWTDLQNATQECGNAPQPSGLLPLRDYVGFGDNGVMSVGWIQVDEFGDPANPFSMVGDSYYSLSFYQDGSDQWQALGGIDGYFPSDPATDRVEATVQIYRALRVNDKSVFAGQFPSNLPAWAELVTEFVVTDLSIASSSNGNIPYKIYGPVSASNLPMLDPDYQYMVNASLNIYSSGGDLVHTGFGGGAIYDLGAEVPDASGTVLQIKQSLAIDPADFDPYNVNLTGYGVVYVDDYPNSESILIYTCGFWRGVMADFICGDFQGTIDGGPSETIRAQCS